MNQKHQQSIYVNANVYLMEKNVIQINGRITRNAGVSVKNMYVKKIKLEIILHVVVKIENIQQVLWMIQQLCVMKLQIIDYK